MYDYEDFFMKLSSVIHKVIVSIPNKPILQPTTPTYWLTLWVLLVLTSIFIRISEVFFGGFTAAKIRRRIRLAKFFSADIRRTKIRRLIQIFGCGLGVYSWWL